MSVSGNLWTTANRNLDVAAILEPMARHLLVNRALVTHLVRWNNMLDSRNAFGKVAIAAPAIKAVQNAQGASFRFSTDDVPRQDRLRAWREVLGRVHAHFNI